MDLVSEMIKLNNLPLLALLGVLPLTLASSGCVPGLPADDGVCTLEPTLDCTAKPDTTVPMQAGLVGYTCTGKARPDDGAVYYDEVPEGYVCADRGATADGKQAYCCSPSLTSCAQDPALPCQGTEAGFQCRGSSRPDAFNAAVNCENGLPDGDYIDYCCTGQAQPPHCSFFQDPKICGSVLQGFTCPPGALPKNEDFGPNESRADNYRFFCPTPKPLMGNSNVDFCCYMPLPPPEGFSCYQDTQVPGCAGGRFGFACYGYDTPTEDYPPMTNCSSPVTGVSAEGYPANLYCCDFQE
jgi:hypothetical protein